MMELRSQARTLLRLLVPLWLTACAHSADHFLPDQDRYIVEWDNEPRRTLQVVGSGSERVLIHGAEPGGCQNRVSTWRATDLGIVEVETNVLLLSSVLVVGSHWLVGGKESDSCVVERRISAMTSDTIDVEEVGVCHGKPLEERTRSRWVLGRGPVRDDFPFGRWRTTTREAPAK